MSKPENLSTTLAHRRSVVAALIAVAALALSAAPARAGLATTFATSGESAGQLNDPVGVAVDRSDGIVYVAEGNNDRIDEFDENGVFIRAFGFGVRTGADELQSCTAATTCQAGSDNEFIATGGMVRPAALVVDPSTHNIFATDFGSYRVEEFTPAGEFVLAFGKEVDKTTHGNVCTAASGDTCQRGGIGTGPGAFSHAASYPYMPLAFDPSGHLWVGDINRLEEFTVAGAFMSEVKLPGAGEIAGLAIDPAGSFYVFSGASSLNEGAPAGIHKYDAAGNPLDFTLLASNVLAEPGDPHALTLDDAGHLFVGDAVGHLESHEPYRFIEFDAETGRELEAFGTDEVLGAPGPGAGGESGGTIAFGDHAAVRLYAVDSQSNLDSAAQFFSLPPAGPLLRVGSPFAGHIGGTSATLTAFLDSEGAETKYHFEYVDQQSFESEGGFASPHTKSTPTATVPAGFSEPEVSAALTGLTGETGYRFRLVATSECEAGKQCMLKSEEVAFQTSPPVAFGPLYVDDVSGESAEFGASIDTFGTASRFRFEYVSEAAYQADLLAGGDGFAGAGSAPVPDGALAASEGYVTVSALAQGLAPGTVYRYRVSARNGGGERHSSVLTLATESSGPFSLLDGRAWELVSPPDKHGGLLEPVYEGDAIQASASGDAISYVASRPTEPSPAGYSNDAQVLSVRGGQGWSSRDIDLPQNAPSGASIGIGQQYRLFSEDLSTGVVQPAGGFDPAISPEASEQTAFLHDNFASGDPTAPCLEGCFHPLVTGAPGVANVPPGTEFARKSGTSEPCQAGLCGPKFVGATPNLSHIVVRSDVGLTEVPGDEGGLYEWSGGKLSLVSVLPNGVPAKIFPNPTVLGGEYLARHAISADGSRVIWSNGTSLYLRDMANEHEQTVKLGAGAVFQDASVDDSRVFFTDEKRLTKDSAAEPGSPDLYECEMVEEAGELKCVLSDLTPAGAGEPVQGVQGSVLGVSADGSYVYFVANTKAGGCVVRQAEADCGLYVRHAGVTRLVATLSGADAPDWAVELSGLTARVSPDGEWLAFMSQRPLTGYDNHDAHSGMLDEEVYLYDATGNGGAGKLVCVSCAPTGARPVGVEYEAPSSAQNMPLAGGDRVWPQNAWIAANIPGWTPYELGYAVYQSRYLSDSGRLFFDSHGSLVAQDTNNTGDVYEYEPAGVGDCAGSRQGFVAAAGGCVGLISSGSSPTESAFLDASENGGDVFFMTAAKLWPTDIDSAIDIYDAHECTGSSPCVGPPSSHVAACEGESCQAPVQPLADLTPASFTFSGLGNLLPPVTVASKAKAKPSARARKLAAALRACRRTAKRKRAACERRARHAYGSAPAKSRAKRARASRRGKSSNQSGGR